MIMSMTNKEQANEYSKGYAAGKKRSHKLIKDLEENVFALQKQLAIKPNPLDKGIPSKHERVYMKALELALKHCDNWRINDKKINDAEGYCTLAEIFAKNSITKF